jgi:hypothetical protein
MEEVDRPAHPNSSSADARGVGGRSRRTDDRVDPEEEDDGADAAAAGDVLRQCCGSVWIND